MKEGSHTNLYSVDLIQNVESHHWLRKASHGCLLLVISFILLQFGVLILKNNSYINKKLLHWDAPELLGQQLTVYKKAPAINIKNFFAKEWQTQFEAWFNGFVPYRNFIVRLHNQIFHHLFSKSYAESGLILIGKNQYLYSLNYVERFYNLARTHFDPASFEDWADDVQSLFHFFKQRGQRFIYLITPSKAAYYSEYLPTCRRCDSSKTRPDYYLAINALKKRNISFIDGSEIILGLKKNLSEKDYIFPQGGIHWTMLGASYVAQELIDQAYNTLLPRSFLKLKFSYKLIQPEHGWDMDLLSLTNLLYPNKYYQVPRIHIVPFPKISKKSLKVAIIGGSFSEQPAKILAESQLFKQIDIYGYLIKGHLQFKNTNTSSFFPFHEISLKSTEPDQYFPEDYQDLFNADVVILEENEENLRSNHFKLLLRRTVGKTAAY